jgi:uncharacterized protein (DUF1015 family)
VPVFSPFRSLRYVDRGAADDLIAPPYDVLSDAQRSALEERHPHNSVRIDFPHGKTDATAYDGVAEIVRRWTDEGVLAIDGAPTFTVYRMTATVDGRTTTTTGVLGALRLEEPGTGDILPHEQTTPKDKADRLNLLRSARVNTSPIWGLSLTAGLGKVCAGVTTGPPDLAATDDGVRHEAWIVSDPATIDRITGLVAASPIVIADGHHRFETALAYQAGRPGDDAGAAAILAYVVELAPEELEIRSIYRLVDAPAGVEIDEVLRSFFDLEPVEVSDDDLVAASRSAGALGLVTAAGRWFARPRADAFPDGVELDTLALATALASVPGVSARYHHDAAVVFASVADGSSAAGVFVRPVRIDQIRTVAETRTRMPPKATFFWPKPRTGVVFRPL